MTDSHNKKSKENRYRNNSSRLNSSEIALIEDVPDGEDAIDRLLQNADFSSTKDTDDCWDLPLDRDESDSVSAIVSRYLVKRKIEPKIRVPNEYKPSSSRNAGISDEFRATRGNLNGPQTIFEINAHTDSKEIDPDIEPIDITRNETVIIENFGELSASKSDDPQGAADIDWNPIQENQARLDNEPFSGSFADFVTKQQALNFEQSRLIENLAVNSRKAIRLGYLAFASALAAIALALALAVFFWQDQNTNPAIPSAVPVILSDDTESSRPKTVPAPSAVSEKTQWYIDLATYEQRDQAAGKAAELIKKGIRSELFQVETNRSTRYVLRVGGFTSQAQAESYSEKIKLALQLKSVRISRY